MNEQTAVQESLERSASLSATQRLKQYIELTDLKRRLEAQLKDTKSRMAELEPHIVEQFQEDGTQSVNMDGFTVYLNRQLFASAADGDKDAMIQAMKGCGDESWSFLVRDSVNSQSLSARIRECDLDENGMPMLPDSLQDVIKVAEVFRLGARKS